MIRLLPYLLLTAFLVGCTFTNPFASQTYTGPTENIVCQQTDLPGSYAVVTALSGARSNQKLITDSTDTAGINQYIATTGRLDGWENRYILVEPSTQLPGFILCEAVTFKTSDGAKQALNWPDTPDWQMVQTDRKIGDQLLVKWVEFKSPDNASWHDYRVEFIYHNILGVVHTYAPADIATADYALNIAEKMLGYFKNPPEGVFVTPTSPVGGNITPTAP